LALISENGKVLYGFGSEQARFWGFGSVRDIPVPDGNPTKEALEINGIREAKTDVKTWFPLKESNAELWEEAVQLGSSKRVLTLLSWANFKA
jgi:hypothetical protein